MSELVRKQDAWIDLLQPVGKFAELISKTEFVPKSFRGNTAAVAACILTGQELGLGPMTALRGIIVIQGRVAMSAEMLGARLFSAGHSLEWKVSTDKEATVTLTRGDGLGSATASWTIEMARRAGLAGHDNYKHYPEAMLRARALSAVVTMAAPDVSLGLEAATDPVERPTAKQVRLAPAAPAAPTGVPDGLTLTKTPELTQYLEQTARPMTTEQIRKVMALLPKGISRDERLELLAGILGRPVETMNNLTVEDGSRIIDALENGSPNDGADAGADNNGPNPRSSNAGDES